MDEEQRRKKEEELDRFWDIDALIPQRKLPPQPLTDTETTEVVLEPLVFDPSEQGKTNTASNTSKLPERHFIPPHTADEVKRERLPDAEYQLNDSLICRVRIFKMQTGHSYYESFLRDAVRLWRVRGEECRRVTFFSYVPQYTQMDRSQLEWYLWWRENARHGVFLQTDYSYLLLYAYELIHLSDRMPPQEVQNALCKLWLEYRELFHQLDNYLPEWICDHGLLHQLPPPSLLQGNALHVAMSHCTLKEYYITASGEEGLLRGLLNYCSNYDFHKSRFYTEQNATLFETMILGALHTVLRSMSTDGTLFHLQGMDASRMVRDAYSGALCASCLRRRIAVEYNSFHCSHQLRYLITDVVKYTENQVRAFLGIRSRLSIYALPTATRALLDAYLQPRLPKRGSGAPARERKAEAVEQERLYDRPRTPLSLSRAAEIERMSWETTERLVEAFEESTVTEKTEEMDPKPKLQAVQEEAVDAAMQDAEMAFHIAMRPYLSFLDAALHHDGAGQKKIAHAMQRPLEALADEINELSADYMGDVLLEDVEVGFGVIEDYIDTVQQVLDAGKE